MTPHVDPQTLAKFAEGKLRRREIPPVLEHLEQCPRCETALEAARDAVAEESGSETPSRNTWLIAVAAVLAIVIAVPLLRDRIMKPREGVERLVELAPRSARVLAPRLTGGFAWAAWRGPMRAGGEEIETQRLRLAGAAADAIDRADRERSADAQHAAGLSLLLIEKPLEAEARIAQAAALEPDDARIWSDLAAARHAAAEQLSRPSLYPRALAAADRALEIEPRLPEALFNRALAIERMGLAGEARAAWEAYLAVDGGSEWAREAREHLRQLPPPSPQSRFEREQPRLERAAASGDGAAVTSIVAADPLRARTYGETWYLGHWGLAAQRGDAQRYLDTARALGAAVFARSGESLLRDSVSAIDTADASRRAALAAAHARYYRARLAYSEHKPAEAESDLRAATVQFGDAPMALAARYYAANARYDQGGVSAARAELEQLLSATDARFSALRAQIRWQLALCHLVDGDWDGALPHLADAESIFTRLGERGHAAFIETLLADALASLGRNDDAWAARIRAFETLSADTLGDRLPVSLAEAARMELRGGDFVAALPLLRLEEAETRRARRAPLLANALVRVAVLREALHQPEAAMRAVREAESVASEIEDAALRERALADTAFASAAVVLPADPRRARELLDRAIDAYRVREVPVFLPEAYLLRARAAKAMGESDAAARDLDAGLAAMERHSVRIADTVVGTGVLDAATSLVDEAILLHLERGDAAAALAAAERARTRFDKKQTFDVRELQRRLAGSDTAVIELVVLPNEVAAFAVTASGVTVARTRVAAADLASAVSRGDEQRLYDILLRPSSETIARARRLILVVDPMLKTVPFAALNNLVERVAVAMAPSAAALHGATREAPRSLLAIALPSGDARGLPESEREIADLAAMYGDATTIRAEQATFAAFANSAARADVVHVAGHTERDPRAGAAALVFAGKERVSWQSLAGSRFAPGAVVVLAACETLRPQSSRARPLSLGDGVLAAGASSVIGTLVPIPDRDAREIFGAVHRHIASGSDAIEAVRRAQIEQMGRGPSWRAVAVLTTRIP